MYKVNYTKMDILEDGTTGNIPQGEGIAYTDCELYNLEVKLANDLAGEDKVIKFHPIIDNIKRIDGHVVS